MSDTNYLDLHMAQQCRVKADKMAGHHERNGWEDLCGDIDNIRGLSPLLERGASKQEIREYIRKMDTACRELLPESVLEAFVR